jgi:hypothetical protein
MGHLWIGQENQDPEDFPKEVWWDAAGSVAASQPLDTIGGYVTNAGSPARYYVSGPYSIRARKRSLTVDPSDGDLIFYAPSVSNAVDAISPGAWPYPFSLELLDDSPPISLQWLGGVHVPWAMQLPTNLTGAGGETFFAPADDPFVATLRLNSVDRDATTGTAIGTFTVALDGTWTFDTSDAPVDLPAHSNLDWYGPLVPDSVFRAFKWTWFGYVQGDGTGAYADVATLTDLNAAVASLTATIADLTATVDALSGYEPGDVKIFGGPAANLSARMARPRRNRPGQEHRRLPRTRNDVLAIGGDGTWGGDGVTTFAIPPSNRYPRGHSGTYPVGTLLDDAMQGHYHEPLGATTQFIGVNGAGNVAHSDGSTFIRDATTGGPVTDGTHDTPRIDSETRPLTAVFTIAIFAGG